MTYRDNTDALHAQVEHLERELAAARAIIDGRSGAPSPAAVTAHALAHPLDAPRPTGLWLCVVDGEGVVVRALAVEVDAQGPYLAAWSRDYGWCGTGDIRHAWPLDREGRPCAWPTLDVDGAP